MREINWELVVYINGVAVELEELTEEEISAFFESVIDSLENY